MAPTTALGKRKRANCKEIQRPTSQSPAPSSSSASSETGEEHLQDIFRRAFEAKFKPLAVAPERARASEPHDENDGEEGDEDEEDTDWAGISEDDDHVEIIDYTKTQLGRDDASKAEMKAFMSSKPPTSASKPNKSLTVKKKPDKVDPADSTNLKNDLDLQKLLRDSHLLSASSSGASTPMLSATGLARHKSTDLHLQSLGAKGSVFSQKKMPMAQRKHMVQKARLTDEKRRAEAREAGIILERPTMNKIPRTKHQPRTRDRAVGLPSVGKFRGGTLSLSKQDVRSITGGGGGKSSKGKSNSKNTKR